MKINWKVLVSCFVIIYLIAFVGSIFTSKSVSSDWYESIKPDITPPNWVFPIVWNALFFLIALSLYFSWINKEIVKKKVMIAFGINFTSNVLWSFFYFGLKNPLIAIFDLFLIWVSVFYIILITYKVDKRIAYLLLPYLIWVSFAGVLNYLSI